MNHCYGKTAPPLPGQESQEPQPPQGWPAALWEVPEEGPRTSVRPFWRKPGVQGCPEAMVMGTRPAHAGGGRNRRPSEHIGPAHVIKDFIQLLGVHDELRVTNHVVDGICLGGDKDRSAVGDGRMGLPSSTTLQPSPSPPQRCCQDLTFSLADLLVSSSIHCRVSRLSSKAVLISAIISSA